MLPSLLLVVGLGISAPGSDRYSGKVENPKPCLTKFSASDDNRCGYKDSEGKTVIPLGKYAACFSDTFCTFAVVADPGASGFVGIDRTEKIIFQVVSFDNGPDYMSEGLFRIESNGKIGFADSNGKIVIPPRFAFAAPFAEGMAPFCNGCSEKTSGEHTELINGKWGYIDKTGKVVLKPIYDKALGFEDGRATVIMDGANVQIDKAGRLFRYIDK